MGKIRWYKRDPDAALQGMADLSLEERGAYNTILDLIYSREGNLKDDDYSIAGHLRCDVRVWRRLRRRLIDLEKLYLHGGCLRNERADEEIHRALSRIASAAEAGRQSWANKQERQSIINAGRLTVVQTPARTNYIQNKK